MTIVMVTTTRPHDYNIHRQVVLLHQQHGKGTKLNAHNKSEKPRFCFVCYQAYGVKFVENA